MLRELAVARTMGETGIQSAHVHERAERILHDAGLQEAYRSSTLRLYTHRAQAFDQVPGFERLRDRARALKREVIENLDAYLEQFAECVERRGGKIHWAADAAEVSRIVLEIAERAGVKEFIKSKTMVGEEVELNHALEAAGIRPIETDLGELIIQLADDRPAHIIAPAIHKTRHDVADLFARHLHAERTTEPERLTAIARRALREAFDRARLGVTGANFAVAETGAIVLVENEGNIRFTTTTPRIHVALVGIEKMIPRLEDLAVFLRLLGRSGTGQKLTAYTSLLTGPRGEGEDGPEEMHVILVDNGRTKALADEKMREALYCIRCGACLNACPVYRKIGGHSYGWVYSGPIGALVTPEFNGIGTARELPFASSLCGACREVCPVRINIPDLLLHLRSKAQTTPSASAARPRGEKSSMRLWSWVMQRPWAYRLGSGLARRGQALFAHHGWIHKLPLFPMSRWTEGRDFPALAPQSFRARWKKHAHIVLIFLYIAACAGAARGAAPTPAPGDPLQVSISLEQPQIVAPFAARAVIHFHNSGRRTLWLYQPAVDASIFNPSEGGSSLAVHLDPAPPQNGKASPPVATPAMGAVLRVPGFIQPQLIAVPPGGGAREPVAIHIDPARLKSASGTQAFWAPYQLTVAYSASFPNARYIAKNEGAYLWSGSVSSNAATITLAPASAADQGMISGKVLDRDGHMDSGILVSLTDSGERLLMQMTTGFDGGFRFKPLSFGRYWVTVRRPGAGGNTSFFEHADVSASDPDPQMKLIMLHQRRYEARQMLQKPVFFRIEDGAGNSITDATLKILWSDGSVTDEVKSETNEKGLAIIDLIPGTNYVTVTKPHCRKLNQMANVAPGGGVDGSSITFDCKK